jgi:hypothetical protein
MPWLAIWYYGCLAAAWLCILVLARSTDASPQVFVWGVILAVLFSFGGIIGAGLMILRRARRFAKKMDTALSGGEVEIDPADRMPR